MEFLNLASLQASPREIRRIVESLRLGNILVLPTETVYGLSVLLSRPNAVARLSNFKGRRPGHAFTIAMSGAAKVAKLLPNLSPLAKRFARRCWPGPLTMVLDMNPCSISIPEPIRQMIAPTGTIGIRVPAHPVALAVLEAIDEPLVLTSANLSGSPPACTAHDAIETLPPGAEIVINGGPCEYSEASTVIRVRGWEYEILRRGVYSEEMVHRLATRVIVFVCTGNTCRSPMAEVLCQNILERGGRSGDCPANATESHFPESQGDPRAGREESNQGEVDSRGRRGQPADQVEKNGENRVRTKVTATGETLIDEDMDRAEPENDPKLGPNRENGLPENKTPTEMASENVGSREISPENVTLKEGSPGNATPNTVTPNTVTPQNDTPQNDTLENMASQNTAPETNASENTSLQKLASEEIASKTEAIKATVVPQVGSPRSGVFWPRGVAVVSAGLAAFEGDTISTLARQTLAMVKLDPGEHKSRQLNEKMLRDADVIFAMAAGHLRAVVSRWPVASDRIRLLSPDGRDIIDPYGMSLQTYQQCAQQILTSLYQQVDLLRDPIDRTDCESMGESKEQASKEQTSEQRSPGICSQNDRISETKAG